MHPRPTDESQVPLTETAILVCYGSVNEITVTEVFVVKLRLRERESIQEAVRRFRKLVEHSGVKKELRKREFYEKPSEQNRRERRRAKNRARMNQMMNG